jgi:HD-GYP domain-containing protein (c-di-GMP phosphodiesterase class II)
MVRQLGGLLSRQRQLNAIAYSVILALVGTVALLAYMLITGTPVPEAWLLLYLADQHRRLRDQLVTSHRDLEQARSDIAAAYDRLAFAHHSAELMTSLTQGDGLEVVLAESLKHFGAEAAGLVGEEVTLTAIEGVDEDRAHSAILQVAMDTVRAGLPLRVTIKDDGSCAVAAPLRIRGKLNAVVALWKRTGSFTSDDLEGLRLVARIVELGIENRALLEEVRTQLSGTIKTLVDLIELRSPDYAPQSTTIANSAVAVGQALGLRDRELADLRLAAMLHDVGMLEVPEAVLSSPSAQTVDQRAEIAEHPWKGAKLAQLANFGERVQSAILCHHERVDGSGYPQGLAGDRIPLEARILGVCDSYVAMISDNPYGARLSPIAAINQLRAGANVAFDGAVVREFVRLHACRPPGDVDPMQLAEPIRIPQRERERISA